MSNVELPSTTESIDGYTYEIRMLDGIASFRMYTLLFAAAGEAAKSVGALQATGDELALRAAGALVAQLKPELLEEFRSIFANSTTVMLPDGKTPKLSSVFPIHFAGRQMSVTKWMLACIKFNFSDFLGENSPLGALLKKAGLPEKVSEYQTA